MSRPDPRIVFHAQLSRVSGDQEQLTVSFNGSDQGELRTRLRQAAEVMDQHVKKHNDKVLDITEKARETLEAARERIRNERDEELIREGRLIPKEANGGADPAGTADLRTDS